MNPHSHTASGPTARPPMHVDAEGTAATQRWALAETFCALVRVALRRHRGAVWLDRNAAGTGILRALEVPYGEAIVWVAAEADGRVLDALDHGFPPGEDIPMLAVVDPAEFDRRWHAAAAERWLQDPLASSEAWAGEGRTQRALLAEQVVAMMNLVRHQHHGTLIVLGGPNP